jgi:hypothetical protein
MKITLTVAMEQEGKKEVLVDASYEVDEKIDGLEHQSTFLLLNAVTSKMLIMQAHETQAMIVNAIQESMRAINLGATMYNEAERRREENKH